MRAGKSPKPDSSQESTPELVSKLRGGDRGALGAIYSRYLAPFQRWVKCRVPIWAKNSTKMDGFVERVLLRSLDGTELEGSPDGGFHSNLRGRILDRLEGELRRISHPRQGLANLRSSLLETTLGSESCARYEAALQNLSVEDRELIIARIELNFPYWKVATVLGQSSTEQARKAIIQALARLAREMGDPHETDV